MSGPTAGRWESACHALLRLLAAAVSCVYGGWQLFWLTQGRIPPALFLALTGLPAPTTGGTRAMLHLAHGEWRASLIANPMAVPITVLFGLSVGWLLYRGLRQRRWSLPAGCLLAWLSVLGVAWAIKLLQHALVPGGPPS